MPIPRLLLFAVVLALASCAAHTEPVAARPADVSAAPVVLAAHEPPLTRKQQVQRILPYNVRVFVYDGETAQRTASGVVVGGRAGDGAYVVTNAHVIEGKQRLANPRYRIVVDRRGESREFDAELRALGEVPLLDLALLVVPGVSLPAAPLAEDAELELGEDVVVAAAPFGRPISLSGGMISHLEWDAATLAPKTLKTDAPIGYGASGGGIYALDSGKLVAIVEGYRTAKIAFDVASENYSFDVPMPGETFAVPAGKLRRFLAAKGFGWLVGA